MDTCKSKMIYEKPVCYIQLGREWLQKHETVVLAIFALLSVVSFYYPLN